MGKFRTVVNNNSNNGGNIERHTIDKKKEYAHKFHMLGINIFI
jgi:hypothetical protein